MQTEGALSKRSTERFLPDNGFPLALVETSGSRPSLCGPAVAATVASAGCGSNLTAPAFQRLRCRRRRRQEDDSGSFSLQLQQLRFIHGHLPHADPVVADTFFLSCLESTRALALPPGPSWARSSVSVSSWKSQKLSRCPTLTHAPPSSRASTMTMQPYTAMEFSETRACAGAVAPAEGALHQHARPRNRALTQTPSPPPRAPPPPPPPAARSASHHGSPGGSPGALR